MRSFARCVEQPRFGLPDLVELEVVEARIWALLDPYRDELEEATIYGIPSLRWPGSGAHDYFAAVERMIPVPGRSAVGNGPAPPPAK